MNQHLSINVELQGKGQLIHNLYDNIHLAKEIVKSSQKYAEYIGIFIYEFQLLFK